MGWLGRRKLVLAVLAAAVCCDTLRAVSGKTGAHPVTGAPGTSAARQVPATLGAGHAFAGIAAIGALFTVSGGRLGTHFCTASVVHSARGDLAVTAAHCMTGSKGQIAFVPDYANGKEPYGVWQVTAVYTDLAWQSAQNPDDDVAFLRLSDRSDGRPIEDVTGAEPLAVNWQEPAVVQVIGYPDGAEQPVTCANLATRFSPTQLEFDCEGYTDGTSGGPFLAGVSAASGRGTIVGVIGGYEQGGDTPQVSYAAAFGAAVAALYHSAESSS
jgi:V8-like Glu-specific endopeptidase